MSLLIAHNFLYTFFLDLNMFVGIERLASKMASNAIREFPSLSKLSVLSMPRNQLAYLVRLLRTVRGYFYTCMHICAQQYSIYRHT